MKKPLQMVPQCGACGLYKTCESPKMPPSGVGRRKVLIVGEAPGADEDREGKQFVGESGRYLRDSLRAVGVDMRVDCWITNAVICRPPGNRTPKKELDYCRPNLTQAIADFQPNVIIPLGGSAVRTLLRDFWKEDVGPVGRWVGFQIPCQKPNVWICPNWHPSYLIRNKHDKPLQKYFRHYLEQAFRLTETPWNKPPDFTKKVDVILDHREAARRLKYITGTAKTVAFDYEANMLKPDGPDAKIVCCSVCRDGEETIAFPWVGKAVRATQELLRSPCAKVAANLKFEERWTLKEFGHGVRNWKWDTMLASHVIDNREGITGLKFQAFVNFGMPNYNHHIEPLLKSKHPNVPNRIKEVDLRDLLLYCGLDSLLEYKVMTRQKKRFK